MGRTYSIVLSGKDHDSMLFEGKIDIVSDMSVTDSSNVTSVPLESGVVIADHVVDKPIKLSMSLVKSNLIKDEISSPLHATGEYLGNIQTSFEVTGLLGSEFLNDAERYTFELDRDRLARAFSRAENNATGARDALVELQKRKRERELLHVYSLIGSFDNMVIESITFREELKSGASLFARVTMVQVSFAKTQEIAPYTKAVSEDHTRIEDSVRIAPDDAKVIQLDLDAVVSAEGDKAVAVEEQTSNRFLDNLPFKLPRR